MTILLKEGKVKHLIEVEQFPKKKKGSIYKQVKKRKNKKEQILIMNNCNP